MFHKTDLLNNGGFRPWQNKLLLLAIIVSMVPIFIFSKSLFKVLAQTQDSTQKKFTKVNMDNEPLEIVQLISNGKTAKFNEKFSATDNDEWLNNLTIKFKNTSNRTITFVNFSLDLRASESTEFVAGDYITFGNRHLANEVKRDDDRVLSPEDTVEVSLTPKSLKNIRTLLNGKRDLKDVSVAQLVIMTVIFDDGTKWSGGRYSKPDPNNSGKFIKEEIHQ